MNVAHADDRLKETENQRQNRQAVKVSDRANRMGRRDMLVVSIVEAKGGINKGEGRAVYLRVQAVAGD